MNMSIDCRLILPNGTEFTYSFNDPYNNRRLWILTSYASMPDDIYLLENTALLKITGDAYGYMIKNGNITRRIEVMGKNYTVISNEKLSRTPEINVVIFLNNVSFSGVTPVSLTFIPASYGGEFAAKNINISFETAVPEYWKSRNDNTLIQWGREFNVTDVQYSHLSVGNKTWFNASEGIIRIHAYRVVKEIGTPTSSIKWVNYTKPEYVFYTDYNTINVTKGEVF
jgi:hypothetical protein